MPVAHTYSILPLVGLTKRRENDFRTTIWGLPNKKEETIDLKFYLNSTRTFSVQVKLPIRVSFTYWKNGSGI